MTLQEFRKLVRQQFGGDLRHMTPANVREFIERVQPEVDSPPSPATSNGRVYLNEPVSTYEGILRDFLARVLEMPSDKAVIRLWLYSLEFTNASVADLEEEKFQKLFASILADENEI